MVIAIRDLTIGVFEYLNITSFMDPDQKLVYIQRILRGVALKIYKVFLLECKESGKDLAGDKWTIGELKGLSTEDLCTWDKSDGISYDRGVYLVMDK